MTNFNVRNDAGQLLCPVCGFAGYSDTEAYTENGNVIAGTAICPCCLWEPGFDDVRAASARASATVLASIMAYRADWMKLAQWQGQQPIRPSDFNGGLQLERLRERAPHLFQDQA